MSVSSRVSQIEEDFLGRNEPFDDVVFPEERLMSELPSETIEEQLRLASIFASFDYNRNANQLVDNIVELHRLASTWFDPSVIAELDEQVVENMFTEIGFRYPSRDAHAWVTNCRIIDQHYHGYWSELLLESGTDAIDLVDTLREDGFLVMKGVKIAPMYARIIDDFVVSLDNVWELDIPVDTHIRRLSRDLFDDPDMSDDEIREEWRGISIELNVNRQVVDGALWQIGNNWNEWGEDYWNSLD